MEYKIIKTSNQIEDICICYGICKILDDNEIDYTLEDFKSYYNIITQEFMVEELEYNDIIDDNIWNINTTLKGNVSSNINNMNKFISDNLINIFTYYLSGELDIKFKYEPSISIGNVFYSLGMRASEKDKSLKINPIKKYLSLLGWIYGCTYCKNKEVEITAILKPQKTNSVKKPFNFSYVDKESGDLKILTRLNGDLGINIQAKIYIETLLKYKMICDEYDKIIFSVATLGGNKPLPNKTFELKIKDYSEDLLEDLKKKITWDIFNVDIKRVISSYIINGNYNNFREVIRTCSKFKNVIFNQKFLKELNSMYDDIYTNTIINKIGRGYKKLFDDNKGYPLQVELLNIKNKEKLFKCIRNIILKYKKYTQYNLITEDEFKELVSLVDTDKKAEVCADTILTLGNLFIKFKEDK